MKVANIETVIPPASRMSVRHEVIVPVSCRLSRDSTTCYHSLSLLSSSAKQVPAQLDLLKCRKEIYGLQERGPSLKRT